MNKALLNEAVELFKETMPLETLDINTQSALWHHLYSQECKLFSCLNKMNEEEIEEYREIVEAIEYTNKQNTLLKK